MLLQPALLSGLFVATQCFQQSAAGAVYDAGLLSRRGLDVDQQLRRHATRNVVDYVERRQAAAVAATAPSAPPAMDAAQLAKWNLDTEQACEKALVSLNGQASNPTGLTACYNLPLLDNSTGVFEAEVRLYNLSAPIDPWVGVKLANVMMTLSYPSATVQMLNATTGQAAKRSNDEIEEEELVVSGLVERQTGAAPAPGTTPPKPSNELKVLMYVGKINPELMQKPMTNSQLQSLLVPTIQLDATNPTTQKPVRAVLSSTEASFVNGVFAKAAALPAKAAATPTSDANLDPPFKVPGISLGVPPIGLIVTLAWTFLFVLTVGLGTVGRIQFRDQYRRRIKNDQAMRINTF